MSSDSMLSRLARGVSAAFLVVLASCTDPLPPAGPPTSIVLLSDAAVTVRSSARFPVRARVIDADQRPVAGATVFFHLDAVDRTVETHTDTVTTDANGEAGIETAIGTIPGRYQIAVMVKNPTRIEPAFVNVNVTPDTIFGVYILPHSAAVLVGQPVQLAAYANVRVGNAMNGVPWGTFRNATPSIITMSVDGPRATVTGVTPGIGLVIAESGAFADTARVVISAAPRPVGPLALGAHHTCMLFEASVYCWGAAPGAGESSENCGVSNCLRSPKAIASSIRFDAIAAGGDQTCAKSVNAAYCWGRGGAVPGGVSTTPRLVPGNLSFTGAITMGRDHACALIDGAAYCWGDNSFGQLGTGDRTFASIPTAVMTTQRFQYLRAGPSFTCGMTVTSGAYCWGANMYGQLGRGFSSDGEPLPAQTLLSDKSGVLSSGAGDHVCIFTGGGPFVYCWGRNDAGQLRDGTTTSSATPRVPANAFGAAFTTKTGTCETDGKAGWCSGSIGGFQYNSDFIFGNGSFAAGGEEHECAYMLRFDGPPTGIYCWGDNSLGALGDGTLKSSRVPVAVAF